MDEQSEVIAFLESAAAHGGQSGTVERIETHGAIVFLVGCDAYKIKRAVRFSYMDFSTLELRRKAIERELAVNRPHAPQIYLRVVPITRAADGRLRIGGTGTAVEWAVHMRRFDQSALLSAIADRGALTPDLARQVADAVLTSHRLAPHVRDGNADARMLKIATDLAHDLAELSEALAPFRLDEFEARSMQALDRARPCLRARGAAGFVARCHGDLHLNNIVLWNGAPVLFDAIEFDETLATIDTLYDLAFLLMDLDHRRHREAANIVLNRYLTRSDAALDIDGLAALPLFLGLRSAVRGLVAAQRGLQQPAQSAPRAKSLAAARSNLDDAVRYLSPPAPWLIAVGGVSGTGKSTLAAALAPHLRPVPGALHIRTDVERKAHFGVSETTRLPPESYVKSASDAIYRRVADKARAALAAGHSVIVDAVFSDPAEREHVENVALAAGVPFSGLWLTAPRETLVARVGARTNDASDATADVVDLQLRRVTNPIEWSPVDAGGTHDATLAAALRLIMPPI